VALALAVISSAILPGAAWAADPVKVTLDTQSTKPREIEPATKTALERDYAAAWQSMAQALDQNQPELLQAGFVGTAADKLAETISEQRKSGLHRRYVDAGHQLQAVFYSAEGSAIELHDTAQLQVQLLDGDDKVIHSENVTLKYIAVLTAAEASWKVRILQEVPAF
jgi:hypothetical protein